MEQGEKVNVAVYERAKGTNITSGDSYFYQEADDTFICAIADGLGSGQFAKESSEIVIDTIKNNPDLSDRELAHLCSEQLVGRRGVVLGVLRLDYQDKTFAYSSIGNIGLVTMTPDHVKNRNIPHRGYLAGYRRDFRQMEGMLEPGMVFIMFSDGIADVDLSQKYFLNQNVQEMIRNFTTINKEARSDDTTLIAMRYIE
ncbi:MAG TPA: SpoIIE family protein phosphatase [Virgibacillus sp.]|nr:SpoIIE family protein phosphatase [Virgibacillus sp.]